jgi:hypothetical protein
MCTACLDEKQNYIWKYVYPDLISLFFEFQRNIIVLSFHEFAFKKKKDHCWPAFC